MLLLIILGLKPHCPFFTCKLFILPALAKQLTNRSLMTMWQIHSFDLAVTLKDLFALSTVKLGHLEGRPLDRLYASAAVEDCQQTANDVSAIFSGDRTSKCSLPRWFLRRVPQKVTLSLLLHLRCFIGTAVKTSRLRVSRTISEHSTSLLYFIYFIYCNLIFEPSSKKTIICNVDSNFKFNLPASILSFYFLMIRLRRMVLTLRR